jgi:hypothetical protein
MQIKLNETETNLMLDLESALSEYCEALESIEERTESEKISDLSEQFCRFRSQFILDENVVNH